MADAVIEILSESGHLQVTGSGGIGYGLSATGAVTLTSDAQNHPQPMVIGSVSVTGQNPVLTYKANGRINVERVSVSGSTFTFNLRAQSSSSIGLQYWIFDTAAQSIKDPTMAGIVAEFRDEYGVVTFDATMAAMRVYDAIETAKPSSDVPFGSFVNLSDTTTITVPAGKVYAIAQATPCFQFLTYDRGGYSNSQSKPNTAIRDDETEPGGVFNWRQQALQSYHSTGGYTSANTIEVGMTRFESFDLGWQPASSTPRNDVYGQARHLIVDVTNFTAAAPINPTQISVGVNATSRSVSTGGAATISQSVTPSVTASASGGSGAYSYLWQFVSGASEVVANGSATGASFSTSTANQPQGSTRSAIWRCRVTDTNGVVGYGPDVTFSHVAEAFSVDVTPDPFSIANFAPNSAAEVAYGTPRVFQITGINTNISLRLARSASSSSPNITLNQLKLRTGPSSSGPWSDVGILYGNGQIDFTASNGAWFELTIEIRTQAGRGTAQYNAEITNQSAGGAPLSAFNFNGVVDNDDNYNNVDTTPDTITNWPSINGVVNENDYSWSTDWYGPHYINGINQPITLRAEVYDYSGNLDALFMDVFTWPPGAGGWTHHGYFAAHVAGPDGLRKMDIGNVVNGTRVAVNPHAITNSGRKSATCRLVLWSITGVGGQFASANQSFVVDNDNNYNVADRDLDPIDWDNASFSTNDNTGAASTGWRTISGINTNINLRVQISNITGQGYNLADGGNLIAVSNVRGDLYYKPWREGGSFIITVQPGEQIRFYCDAYTTQGRKQYGFDVSVYNDTTGAFVDQHYQSGILDADNNWNMTGPPVISLSTTYLVPGHEFQQSGRNITVEAGAVSATVTGGSAPLTYQWERTDGTAAWSIVGANTNTATIRYSGRTNFYAEGYFRLVVTDSQGRVAYSDGVFAQVSAGNAEA